MTKELNCCGLACPEPVIRCRRMLEEEKPASLRVLVDNTAASENVSRFLGRTGYSVEVRQEGADLWCVSATACGCRVTEPEPAAATLTPGKTLVLITTETFGRGDDDGQGVEDGPGKDYGENGCCQCGNVIFSPFLAQGFYCFFCGFYMKAHECMITCLPHMLSNMRITRVTCR